MMGLGTLTAVMAARDPFWPIGFDPDDLKPTPAPETPGPATTPTPEVVRELSDAELRALAAEEARRISDSFVQKATMEWGGKIIAYVDGDNIIVRNNNPWVSEGDHFFIKVHGQRYRMEVVRLTKTRIELEPHRVANQP
jgi:hypothetical protein